MIKLSHYQNCDIAVFGLGKAGEAAVAALVAGNARVFAWDDKPESRNACAQKHGDNITLALPADWPWPRLSALVLSPGIPLTHPQPHASVLMAKQANVPVIGDIELLYQAQPEATYIGITGTNGKSTTTTLIAHILKEAGRQVEVGGNLGTPVLSFKALGKGGIYVIECSSYQLDLIHAARFHVAVLLNLTPDHLDRHGDMQGYLAAKKRIFMNQREGDTAVVAVDDEYTRKVADLLGERGEGGGVRKIVRVSAHSSLQEGVYVENGILHDATRPSTLTPQPSLTSIPTLPGRHNHQNAAAAYAACRAVGVEPEVIFAAMKTFPGLAHRMEQVAVWRGVRFINDSKATNADATANALAPYENIHWILGGKPKAGGIESLTELFPHVAHAYLIGEAAPEFARTLEGKIPTTQCGTLDIATRAAAEAALEQGRGVVLLSPACASFDQFKSFEHRGDVFRELVQGIINSDTVAGVI